MAGGAGGDSGPANTYLEQLGDFGKFQAYVYLFCAVPAIITGMVTFSNVFLLAQPKHRCVNIPAILTKCNFRVCS